MRILFVACFFASLATSALAGQVVLDESSHLKTSSIPSSTTSDALVAVISSPDNPSKSSLPSPKSFLSLESACLACRGPTLSLKPLDLEWRSIALCSLTAAVLVLDGITDGDVEAGIKNSRHGVTLTALFRAKAMLAENPTKQTIFLYVNGEVPESAERKLMLDVQSLFSAAVAETKEVSFDKAYGIQVVSSQTKTGEEVRLSEDVWLSRNRRSHMVDLNSEAVVSGSNRSEITWKISPGP